MEKLRPTLRSGPRSHRDTATDYTQSHKSQVSCLLVSNHSEATPPDVAGAWRPEGQTGCLRVPAWGAGMQPMPSCPTRFSAPLTVLPRSCHPSSWPESSRRPKTRASASTPGTLVLKWSPLLPHCQGTESEKFLFPSLPGLQRRGGAGGKPGQSFPCHRVCRLGWGYRAPQG